MRRLGRRRAKNALLVMVLAAAGCASRSGYDGESHFVCSIDSQCLRFGTGYACVERRCTPSPIVAPDSSFDPVGTSTGGRGGNDERMGSARDAGSGGNPTPRTEAGPVLDSGSGERITEGSGGSPTPRAEAGPVLDSGSGGQITEGSSGSGGRIGNGGGVTTGGNQAGDASRGDAEARHLSPIVGIASKGPGSFDFVRIDPTTGKELRSVPLTSVSGVNTGITGWDPKTARFYALVYFADPLHRLLGVDATTGAVVSSPAVDFRLDSVEVDAKGDIFGIEATGVSDDSYVSMSVNPTTGVARTMSDLTGNGFLTQGMSAIDAARRRYYQVMSDGAGTQRILTLDTSSGTVVASIPTDSNVNDIEMDADGSLVGFVLPPGREGELRFLDPTTGKTTFIANAGISNLYQGDSAIDRDAHVVYHTYAASDGTALLSVDIASGHVSHVPLARGVGEIVVCSACR